MTDLPPALFKFFEAMPRQGPGSPTMTAALYRQVWPMLPEIPVVADMGCGSGAAGLVLAEMGALVTGVDIHRPFLDAFERAAGEHGLSARVTLRRASMTDSGIDAGSLDLVWSEGAVFTVGFDRALEAFRRLLKPDGLAVVSEASWLQRDAPDAVRDYWAAAYPAMRTVGGNLAAAESGGWRFIHAETLAPDTWESEFYGPMEHLIQHIEAGTDDALKTFAAEQKVEIDLFRRYQRYFGYVFYVLQVV